MKAFISILTTLACTLFTTILANPMDRALLVLRQDCAAVPCDACAIDGYFDIGLWGIFPNAQLPMAACFKESDTTSSSSIGCLCTFDNSATTPAAIGYQPNVPFFLGSEEIIDRGRVELNFTANDDSNSGVINVYVYSPWGDESEGIFPLIGALTGLAFPPDPSESYVVPTTLPDPMKFTITKTPQVPGGRLFNIDVYFTYGTQTFTFNSVLEGGGFQNIQFFDITNPPSNTWWY